LTIWKLFAEPGLGALSGVSSDSSASATPTHIRLCDAALQQRVFAN
jgi:hypothetical protein